MTLQADLNRLAGTTGLDAQLAANVWAGTTGRDLVAALNAKNGTTGLELNGVLKALALTYGGNPSMDANGSLATAVATGSPTSATAGAPDVAMAAANATVSTAAGGTTFTINASTQSGYIESSDPVSGNNYAFIREGTVSGGLAAESSGIVLVGQDFAPVDTYYPDREFCYEGFLDFSLASLTGTVSTATLSLGLNSDSSTQGFTVEARTRDWGATLTTGDWVAGSALGALTLLATLASSGIGSTGEYKAMTQSGTALKDAVVAAGAGTLRIILCSDRHRLNNEPGSSEYLIFEEYNHATLKPKLVVVTT